MKELSMRVMSQKDLIDAGLLDFTETVEDVKQALISHENKETMSMKAAIDLRYGWKIDSLISTNGDYATNKWLGANTDNHKLGIPRSFPMITLNDKHTGRPLCFMEGSLISALRTGAYVALAVEHLAPDDSDVLFAGTGVISKAAASCLFNYEPAAGKVRNFSVYSGSQEYAERFKAEVENNLLSPGAVHIAKSIDDAVGSDVTVSLNSKSEILFHEGNVKPDSTHIHLGGQDDDLDYIARCGTEGKIICDDWYFVKKRDIQNVAFAHDQKKILDRHIYGNLGEVIKGTKKGREGDELIYFNAVGLPELDMFVAIRLYQNAMEKGLGTEIVAYDDHPNWILGK